MQVVMRTKEKLNVFLQKQSLKAAVDAMAEEAVVTQVVAPEVVVDRDAVRQAVAVHADQAEDRGFNIEYLRFNIGT
jgi:uncharacterized membrane protein